MRAPAAPRLNVTGSFVLGPDPARMSTYVSRAAVLTSPGLRTGRKSSAHAWNLTELGLKTLNSAARRRRSSYHKTPLGRCKAGGGILSASVVSACPALPDPDPPSNHHETGWSQCSHPDTSQGVPEWVYKTLAGVGPLRLSSPRAIWDEAHKQRDIFSKPSYGWWTESTSLVSTSSKYEAGGDGRKVSRTEMNIITFHQANRTPNSRIKIAVCQLLYI